MIDQLLKEVVRRLKINTFVETGTDMGETIAEVSQWFAESDPGFGKIVKFVETGARSYNKWNTPIRYPQFGSVADSEYKMWSVEFDQTAYRRAVENFSSNRNITLINESSEQFLNRMLPSLAGRRALFFLDAHWGKFWPIKDELKAIDRLERFVVAIDDFFVPGKSDVGHPRGEFGFDFYHDRILCWGYVRDCFELGGVRVFYPEQPNRDRRGWCVITRGYGAEVDFMGMLGLSEMSAEDPAHSVPLRPRLSSYLDIRTILRMIFPLAWLRRGYEIARSR